MVPRPIHFVVLFRVGITLKNMMVINTAPINGQTPMRIKFLMLFVISLRKRTTTP